MTLLQEFGDVLAHARTLNGKNDKQKVVGDALRKNPALAKLFNLALSPYITFGLAKLPDMITMPSIAKDEAESRAFELFDALAARKITGGAAQRTVGGLRSLLDLCGGTTLDAFDSILLKDLRAGFSESTVNKAVPGTVPVFECQLAPSELANVDKLAYPVQVEPKYDGIRTIAIKRDGVVTLYSRNGIPFLNFAEMEDLLTIGMEDNTVYDGEMLHRDLLGEAGFKLVNRRSKLTRGEGLDIPVRFQAFDGMPLHNWDKKSYSVDQQSRTAALAGNMEKTRQRANTDLLSRCPNQICADVAAVQAYYAEMVADGFEGVMIKETKGLYRFKRRAEWQKMKPFETADLNVTGVTEGEKGFVGTLGAVTVEGRHAGKHIITDVGSGFTDEERKAFWKNPSSIIGQIMEVKYQDITQRQDRSDETYSLRFPTYVRLRGTVKI